MKKVRVLLIAIGGYGTNYYKELVEKNVTSVQVEGVCEVMKDVDEKFPLLKEKGIPVYHSPEEFYREHQADLAVIASPMHLHFEQTKYCLEHGSNVMLEKPVCTSIEDAEELQRIEEATGHFVCVGYQWNYDRQVWALKQDILAGKFGKPVSMKAMHALRRGDVYYRRNNWAGKIRVGNYTVNDSPFNNANAHQFQNMTFLLGERMDSAARIGSVEAELYRANSSIENFDTAAVHATTESGVDLYYYTTHNEDIKEFGPFVEYEFEKATIYYGKDFGEGPVKAYVAVWKDGTKESYAGIDRGDRLQKLYDALECTEKGGHPTCTIQCALPHLKTVLELAKLPIRQIREEELEHVEEDGIHYCEIRNLRDIFTTCYNSRQMPSETGVCW
jgi:predicted dehydrogenase